MGWARPARAANGRAGAGSAGWAGSREAPSGARLGALRPGAAMTALSPSEAVEAGR
jgi:hypothetical protein